jgi:hypothetical protein
METAKGGYEGFWDKRLDFMGSKLQLKLVRNLRGS